LQCNAFWLDQDASQGCDLSIIEEVAYGFRQVPEVKAILSPSPLDNFCASAKHESSPNTYSIDGASVMSEGGDCGGTGGSVQTASAGGSVKTASVSPAQTFEDYQAPEIACKTQRGEPYHTAAGISGRKYVVGAWIIVDSKGRQVEGTGGSVCTCDVCGPEAGDRRLERRYGPNDYKYVFVSPSTTWDEEQGVWTGNTVSRCNASRGNKGCTYDFETQTYLDSSGNRWATSHWNKRVE
jgi:hypothetical protein